MSIKNASVSLGHARTQDQCYHKRDRSRSYRYNKIYTYAVGISPAALCRYDNIIVHRLSPIYISTSIFYP